MANAAPGRVHDFAVRVTYADTDQMGVVYYANYLRYFEQGRTELLRSLRTNYRDLELRHGLYLPVTEAVCRYEAPGRYDDLLLVRTWVLTLGRASISFAYEMLATDAPGRRLAVGRTRHAVVDEAWKPARLPGDLRAALAPFQGPGPVGA